MTQRTSGNRFLLAGHSISVAIQFHILEVEAAMVRRYLEPRPRKPWEVMEEVDLDLEFVDPEKDPETLFASADSWEAVLVVSEGYNRLLELMVP